MEKVSYKSKAKPVIMAEHPETGEPCIMLAAGSVTFASTDNKAEVALLMFMKGCDTGLFSPMDKPTLKRLIASMTKTADQMTDPAKHDEIAS